MSAFLLSGVLKIVTYQWDSLLYFAVFCFHFHQKAKNHHKFSLNLYSGIYLYSQQIGEAEAGGTKICRASLGYVMKSYPKKKERKLKAFCWAEMGWPGLSEENCFVAGKSKGKQWATSRPTGDCEDSRGLTVTQRPSCLCHPGDGVGVCATELPPTRLETKWASLSGCAELTFHVRSLCPEFCIRPSESNFISLEKEDKF